MARAGIDLAAVGMIAAGGVLAYSGVNDPVGGPVGVVRDVLQGKTPTPGVRVATAPTAGAQGIVLGPIQGSGLGEASSSGIGVAGSRATIMATARSYLGVMYRFGGASRSGIDCSGLVLVSYKAVGISLPHLATAQAARGRRIPREAGLPGDLVAWGVPGNYPHIALMVDQNTIIHAYSWGKPVGYGTLWAKRVTGFGYPDIIRILP